MKKLRHSATAIAIAAFSLLSLSARLPATEFMAEGFDSQQTAHIGLNNGVDATVAYVDYTNMLVGATTHHIPEAPRQIAGSLPGHGVLLKMSYAGATANERIANLIALDDAGGSRLTLTDNYRLRFDFYLRVSPLVTLSAVGTPTQAGTTEDLVWGVGYQATSPMGRLFRSSRGSGVWGHLATEGGYGATTTGGDAGLWVGAATNAAGGRSIETEADRTAFFTPAFGADATPVPNCPANQWVEADITVGAGKVTVEYGAAGRTKTKFYENISGGS